MNLYYKLLLHLILDKQKRRACKNIFKNNLSNQVINLSREEDMYLQNAHLINMNTFKKYKNMFNGKDVVIVGAGPTLSNYIPIKNAIHIGTNKTYKKKGLKLDFLFWQDFRNYDKRILDENMTKFLGHFAKEDWNACPESLFNNLKDAHKFVIATESERIPVDIGLEPLWHGGSVAFSAFQFALYTNPKRIYLVGCDCAGASDQLHWQHFDDKTSDKKKHNLVPITALLDGWKKLFQFAQKYYPETELISINPIGLKGILNDIFTEPDLAINNNLKEKK